MKYKILKIDQEKQVIEIEVTWDDKSKYWKRMMADTSSELGITSSVEKWLKDYLEGKAKAEAQAPIIQDVSKLLKKTVTVE